MDTDERIAAGDCSPAVRLAAIARKAAGPRVQELHEDIMARAESRAAEGRFTAGLPRSLTKPAGGVVLGMLADRLRAEGFDAHMKGLDFWISWHGS